jgi:acetyl esterase/lipase
MTRLSLLLLFVPSFSVADAPPTYPDKTNLLVLRNPDGKQQPITDTAGWAKRRAHILRNMQEVMGPLPDDSRKVPLDPKVEDESDQGTYTRYKMTIAVEKGDRLPLYLLVPKKRDGELPAVVCPHPTSREFGKGIAAGFGGKPDRHYAVHLAERGYVAVAPDYVNMGEHKFDPYANGYASATMKGIWNHMRCVDYLQSRPEVDPDRIGAIGHSLGGHNSIFLGVFDERVKCVVSNCGFCSFPT